MRVEIGLRGGGFDHLADIGDVAREPDALGAVGGAAAFALGHVRAARHRCDPGGEVDGLRGRLGAVHGRPGRRRGQREQAGEQDQRGEPVGFHAVTLPEAPGARQISGMVNARHR